MSLLMSRWLFPAQQEPLALQELRARPVLQDDREWTESREKTTTSG